jgi:cell division GTPase FtsZ
MDRLLIGIGQCGADILENISRDLSVPTAAIDLDKYTLHACNADSCILVREGDEGNIGGSEGLGIDFETNMQSMEEIERLMRPYDVIYIMAALGGRAGGVVLPAVAKKAQNLGKNVRGKIVLPFEDEKNRRQIAELYLEEIRPLFTDIDVYDNHEYVENADGEVTLDSLYHINSIFEEINRDILREIQRDIVYEDE